MNGFRLSLLVAFVAVLSGCAAVTRTVPASDPSAVYETQATLRGRDAEIALVSGESAVGRIDALRLDSTVWHEGSVRRAVPTSSIVSIAVDRRARTIRRGALMGAGVGLAFALLPALDPDNYSIEFGLVIGAATIPGGALYGTLIGATEAKRVTYQFETNTAASVAATQTP